MFITHSNVIGLRKVCLCRNSWSELWKNMDSMSMFTHAHCQTVSRKEGFSFEPSLRLCSRLAQRSIHQFCKYSSGARARACCIPRSELGPIRASKITNKHTRDFRFTSTSQNILYHWKTPINSPSCTVTTYAPLTVLLHDFSIAVLWLLIGMLVAMVGVLAAIFADAGFAVTPAWLVCGASIGQCYHQCKFMNEVSKQTYICDTGCGHRLGVCSDIWVWSSTKHSINYRGIQCIACWAIIWNTYR